MSTTIIITIGIN